MAWLAVAKYNKEYIFKYKPFRGEGYWIEQCRTFYEDSEGIQLPRGTIKKLIGRNLTWKDTPVELK